MLRAHDYEEHREVSALPNAVSIQVGSDAHAVAVGTGVERWGVEADCASINSISIASLERSRFSKIATLFFLPL